MPEYLARLEAEAAPDAGPGADIHAALKGDLHLHSDWSDGGAAIEQMARKAIELGHEYLALTDHSPQLTIAHGLEPERLEAQLEVVGAPQRRARAVPHPHRDRGRHPRRRPPRPGAKTSSRELDVVVASVHSKLRMAQQPMTDRMVAAMANPHTDVLGHCTGRLVLGKGRPESTFDADLVFGVCAHFDKAVEINCRPERLDPPMRLLEQVVAAGCKVSIDSDAHAVGQLEWQPYGCRARGRGRRRRRSRSSTRGRPSSCWRGRRRTRRSTAR